MLLFVYLLLLFRSWEVEHLAKTKHIPLLFAGCRNISRRHTFQRSCWVWGFLPKHWIKLWILSSDNSPHSEACDSETWGIRISFSRGPCSPQVGSLSQCWLQRLSARTVSAPGHHLEAIAWFLLWLWGEGLCPQSSARLQKASRETWLNDLVPLELAICLGGAGAGPTQDHSLRIAAMFVRPHDALLTRPLTALDQLYCHTDLRFCIYMNSRGPFNAENIIYIALLLTLHGKHMWKLHA